MACAVLAGLAVAIGGRILYAGEIVFASQIDGDSDIYQLAIDRNILFNLTSDWNGWETQPIWSPNGNQLAFLSFPVPQTTEVYVADSNGSNLRKLADFQSQVARILWSPDSKYIAIAVNGSIRILDTEFSAPRFSVEGECSCRNIVSSDLIVGSIWDWSPDGSQILFSTVAETGEIFSVSPSGSNIHQLTENDHFDIYAEWSPDSKQIAYLSLEEHGWQIYFMDQDGSNLRRIGDPISIPSTFEWSPDGGMIVFSSWGAQGQAVYIVSVEDGTVEQITNNGLYSTFPFWLPSSSQIAFVEENRSDTALVIINSDGNRVHYMSQNLPPIWAWKSIPDWRPQP